MILHFNKKNRKHWCKETVPYTALEQKRKAKGPFSIVYSLGIFFAASSRSSKQPSLVTTLQAE